jgi:hypothetical protein
MPVAQVKALLVIASQISGYPIVHEDKLPPVYLVTAKEMVHEGCEDNPMATVLGCPIIGLYAYPVDGQVERIVVEDDKEASGHSANAILVHELTHWLQHQNWTFPDLHYCPREFLREYEAYLAGFRYEVIYEHVTASPSFTTPEVECPFTTSG